MSVNHGANLYELSQKFGVPENDWVDFSSNINPFGLSPAATTALKAHLTQATVYPDPDYHKLRSAISKYASCHPDDIILGNGATNLITDTIRTINPRRAVLIMPSYSEYEKELAKINCQVKKYFYLAEENFQLNLPRLLQLLSGDIDMLIICNPNNPTGTLISQEQLRQIACHFTKPIMVDETYIEFTDTEKTSAASLVNEQPLVVIRSTSKFFSTPGLRLGYAIASPGKLRDTLQKLPTLWNINVYAELMGTAMFQDQKFIQFCREAFKRNFAQLQADLQTIQQIRVYPSSSNFILSEIIDSTYTVEELYNYLLKFGFIIRKAASFEGLTDRFFRVCVLSQKHNQELIVAIKKFFTH